MFLIFDQVKKYFLYTQLILQSAGGSSVEMNAIAGACLLLRVTNSDSEKDTAIEVFRYGVEG